jgi:hypothetical protein
MESEQPDAAKPEPIGHHCDAPADSNIGRVYDIGRVYNIRPAHISFVHYALRKDRVPCVSAHITNLLRQLQPDRRLGVDVCDPEAERSEIALVDE